MDGTQYTDNFTNIGKMIDMFNQIEVFRGNVRTVEEEASVLLNDDQDEIDALQAKPSVNITT